MTREHDVPVAGLTGQIEVSATRRRNAPAAIPAAFYALTGGVLLLTGGMFAGGLIPAYASLALLAISLTYGRQLEAGPRTEVLLWAVLVASLTLLLVYPRISIVRPPLGLARPWIGAALIFVVLAAWGIWRGVAWLRIGGGVFAAAVLVAARVVAIRATPDPQIDVFTWGAQASDYLLRGMNPYAQRYTDVNHGQYGYTPGFYYWPAVLLSQTGSRFLFGDIRYTHVLADVVTAIAIWRMGIRHAVRAAVRDALPLLWLAFPVCLMVVTRSWNDPLLIAGCVVMLAFLLEGQFMWAGVALGFACACKQYMIFAALLSGLLALRLGGWPKALRLAASATIVYLAFVLPFLLWNPSAFVHITVSAMLSLPSRRDAFGVAAWLQAVQVPIPRGMSIVASLSGFALAVWWLATARSSESGVAGAWTGGVAVTYALTFLFGQNAFLNYFLFVSAFVLLQVLFATDHAGARLSNFTRELPGARR